MMKDTMLEENVKWEREHSSNNKCNQEFYNEDLLTMVEKVLEKEFDALTKSFQLTFIRSHYFR